MDDTADSDAQVRHVYDFARLERLPEGALSLEVTATGKSSTGGAVLTGRSLVCTLTRQAAASAATREAFSYVLHGTLVSDIEGDRVSASKGAILHAPRGVAHAVAGSDEDLLVFAVEHAGEDVADAAPAVPGHRYVYDMREVRDTAVGPASAQMTPDSALRLPPRVTGKLLTGERLHVGVLRLEPGAKMSNYRKDNEQFVFVAEGELEVTLDEEHLSVAQYCVLHLPHGTQHELQSAHGATIVMAQDREIAE